MPTPNEWLDRLNKRLDERGRQLDRLNDYYEGHHNLRYATRKFREAFGPLFSSFSDNFCALVADAVEERLTVVGFRFGEDLGSDEDANRIWQDNALDATSQLAHSTALVKTESSVIVSPYRSDWPTRTSPLITIEDPRETVIDLHPANPRRRRAALKRWVEDRRMHANLYLPEALYKFRSQESDWNTTSTLAPVQWERRDDEGDEAWPLPNPLQVVPVIPLINRPRLDGTGRSEIDEVMPLQDAVNKLVSDMLLASEFSAFPQRYGINIEIETDEDTGQQTDAFRADVTRMWTAPPPEDGEPETKFGQFPAASLEPYVKAIDTIVQHMASITRTPQHYFIRSAGQPPSGESIKSAETGLVAKARDKQLYFGEAWEEAIRLSFRALSDERADQTLAETIWGDPESRTESERVDALIKMGTLGVPREALWEKWGATPQEIGRWKAQEAEQSLLGGEGETADVDELAKRVEMLGGLIRAGYDPTEAAALVGLPTLRHTGLPPITLKDQPVAEQT